MKTTKLAYAACLCGLLLSGCLNIEPALSGRAYEEYVKSIKPYIAYWEKHGATEEERLRDWVACGGKSNGTFSWDLRKKLPGERDDAARTRLEHGFERCMIRTGYGYTGDCSSEYMKSQPLCGAP